MNMVALVFSGAGYPAWLYSQPSIAVTREGGFIEAVRGLPWTILIAVAGNLPSAAKLSFEVNKARCLADRPPPLFINSEGLEIVSGGTAGVNPAHGSISIAATEADQTTITIHVHGAVTRLLRADIGMLWTMKVLNESSSSTGVKLAVGSFTILRAAAPQIDSGAYSVAGVRN